VLMLANALKGRRGAGRLSSDRKGRTSRTRATFPSAVREDPRAGVWLMASSTGVRRKSWARAAARAREPYELPLPYIYQLPIAGACPHGRLTSHAVTARGGRRCARRATRRGWFPHQILMGLRSADSAPEGSGRVRIPRLFRPARRKRGRGAELLHAGREGVRVGGKRHAKLEIRPPGAR